MTEKITTSRGSRGSRVETFFTLLLSLISHRDRHPREDGHPPREPREPREVGSAGIPPAAAYWERATGLMAARWPVCIDTPGFHHDGRLAAVRLAADGTCRLRFDDGVTVTLPAAREVLR